MAVIEWKSFLIPYDQAVEELKVKFRSIRRELRKKNEYSPIEFVTGRVKEVSSILEKANKFDIPLDRIQYEMEDIAGLRIMCQFVDIIYEKDYVTNVKSSGYRSYHMIIKYPVNMASGMCEVLAEFQIRTLAMNFWATVEHSLNYKYKHAIPIDIKGKLKSAADAAFNLDTEMLAIKDEIKDAQKLFEVKSSLVSNIVENILTISSLGKTGEASRFTEELNKLLEVGDVFELTSLLEETKKVLERYK